MSWINLNWIDKRLLVVFFAVILKTITPFSIYEVNAIDVKRTNDSNSQLSQIPRLTRSVSDEDYNDDYDSYEDSIEDSDRQSHKDHDGRRHGNRFHNGNHFNRRNGHRFYNRHGRRHGGGSSERKFDIRNVLRRSRVKLPNGELSSVIDPYVIDWECKKRAKLLTFHKNGLTSRREFELLANEMERTKMDISNCTYRGGCYKTYKIVKIQKIINGCVWKRYQAQKKAMEAHMAVGNERLLFHGTDYVWGIVNNGFDKPTGVAGSYGAGIYFTDRSSAANEFVFGRPIGQHGCSKHDDQSCTICERMLLLCRVNLGKKFNKHGGGNYTKAPVGFHSVAGKRTPTMFTEYVVYKREQGSIDGTTVCAKKCQHFKKCFFKIIKREKMIKKMPTQLLMVYPEYLITYKIEK